MPGILQNKTFPIECKHIICAGRINEKKGMVIKMVYFFLADGFEEVEALCPIDLLRRAGSKVTTVAVGGGDYITGSHGINVKADAKENDLDFSDAEMVVLPGGMPGTLNLEASPVVKKAVDDAYNAGKFVCAICAAPSVLGKRGYLRSKEAICYPGFEKFLDGAKISDKKVVRDGNIITGAGMGVALDFGLALVSALHGDKKASELRASVIAD